MNWTSLGNVTTVTKTGLTLSVGQTYFFSVQAVNGAGLTGSATNSNGQTVVAVSNVDLFPGQLRELDRARRRMEQCQRREFHSHLGHEHRLCDGRQQEPEDHG